MQAKTVLLSTILAAFASASLQGQQAFGLTNGSTFTSRGSLGTGAGELQQGFPSAHHRGIGEQTAGCVIQAVRATVQDQNSATTENYEVVVRAGTDNSGPTAQIVRVGPLSLPPGNGGAIAYQVTTTFQSAIVLPGCDQFFAAGVALPAAPNWTADGLSIRLHPAPQTHSRAQSHAWEINTTATTRLAQPASWGIELLTDAAVLQMGNGVGNYTMEGIFPATGNDITARARFAPSLAGGICALWLGTWRQGGTPIFPASAKLYIAGTLLPAGRRAIDPSGEVEMTIARNIPPAVIGAGVFHFQAAGLQGSTAVLTNTYSILP